MTSLYRLLALTAAFAASVNTASAVLYNLSGTINAAQEVPTNGSTGTGNILGTYDDGTGALNWNISFSGLSGAASGMHFHGPAGPGVNANVRVNIGNISGLTSPSNGGTTITSAFGAELVAGNWYVNIHTASNPGGEIRGQVTATPVPEPSMALLGALTGLLAFRRRRS